MANASKIVTLASFFIFYLVLFFITETRVSALDTKKEKFAEWFGFFFSYIFVGIVVVVIIRGY